MTIKTTVSGISKVFYPAGPMPAQELSVRKLQTAPKAETTLVIPGRSG